MREGIKLFWYKDTLGYLTGGYGHKKLKTDPQTFGQYEADLWLEKDINGARKAALKQLNKCKYQTQMLYDVLVSCNFQFGNDFDTDFPNSFAYLAAGEFDKAISGFLKTKWYQQTPTRVKDLVEAIKHTQLCARQYDQLGL